MSRAARSLTVAVVSLVASCALCGCGGPDAPSGTLAPAPVAAATDLGVTALATLPMGISSSPVNTFWQLLVRGAGGRWRLATPPDVATNGGVVVTGAVALTAGVLPSQALRFSPLATSPDLGRRWSTAVVPAALASSPSALATDGPRTYALLASMALVASTGLATWSTIATLKAIDATADPGCRLASLTGVAQLQGTLLVGGGCAPADGRPLEARSSAGWHPIGPRVTARAVTVLRVVASAHGLVALLELALGAARVLVVAHAATPAGAWSTSAQLPITGARVVSTGIGEGAVQVVLEGATGSRRVVEVEDGGRWAAPVALPAHTVDVVGAPAATLEALAASGSILTVFSSAPEGRWRVFQRLYVPISYGSSS